MLYAMNRMTLLLLMVLHCWSPFQAQELDLQLYHEQNDGAIEIYADNQEYYPVTISIDPKVSNMNIDPNYPNPAIVPPRSERVLISRMSPQRGKSWKFSYSFQSFPGDVLHTTHDPEEPYMLPYRDDQTFIVSQGYNGRTSHRGENALDFDMPEGTEILAARSGVVTDVVDRHSKSCPDESCNQYNNVIRILHQDGTFAEYAHLKKNGAQVIEGQEVEAGEVIGLSGKTGWTTGPHLHFIVFKLTKKGRESLETDFQTRDGEVKRLREGEWY